MAQLLFVTFHHIDHPIKNSWPMNPEIIALDEIALINRIVAGEKHLFETIIKTYNKRLYRTCMGILHDDDEVEDVMQIAYIKAYENLNRFEGRSSFSTWLTRIAINESLMRLKKINKLAPIEALKDLAIENQHPMKTVMNQELKEIVEKAILELPSKYRIVFMLREVEGMSVAGTQACLELTEANVKVRLNRAKEMLRESLTHYVNREEIYEFHLDRCNRVRESVMEAIVNR